MRSDLVENSEPQTGKKGVRVVRKVCRRVKQVSAELPQVGHFHLRLSLEL